MRRNELAVGHDRTAVGREFGDRRDRICLAQAGGREDRQAHFLGARLHGARARSATASGRGGRSREDGHDFVTRSDQRIEARESHVRGAGENQAHAVTATWRRQCGD